MLVTLYSFVDRQVFVLQAEPIRRDMDLSDFQLGLLQGLGVSLFAAAAGVPVGWLADRLDRRLVLAGCVVVWSLAVAACALAQNFAQLFVAGAMVGAGEAGLIPIALAMIPAMFFNQSRQLANSINQVAGRLGVGLAIALCGYLTVFAESLRPWLPGALADTAGWRLTLLLAALPAPAFVVLLLTLPNAAAGSIRARLTSAVVDEQTKLMRLGDFVRQNRPALFGFYGAMTIAIFGFAALGVWLPVVAMRQFGATTLQVGNSLGAVTFVCTLIGMLFTIYGLRWLRRRVGARVPMWTMGASIFLIAAAVALLPLADSARSLFMIYGLGALFITVGVMIYPTLMQDMSPPHLRARIFAIAVATGALAAAGSPPLIGLISDQLGPGRGALLHAVVVFVVPCLVLAASLMVWASRHYLQTAQAALLAGDQAQDSASTTAAVEGPPLRTSKASWGSST
jgi:MFS family permease